MALDIQAAISGAKLDPVGMRTMDDLARRLERFIRSDRIRNLAPQIRSEFHNLGHTVPTLIIGRIRLACADLIISKLKNVDLACQSCYIPIIKELDQIENQKQTSIDNLSLRAQARFGYVYCMMQSVIRHDTRLCFSDSINTILNMIKTIQVEIANIFQDPSVCWLIYNGCVLLYTACSWLTEAGRGPDALPFLNWTVLVLERGLALQSAPACRLYIGLYDLIVRIALQNGADSMANSILDRAGQKISELQGSGNTCHISVLDAAHLSISNIKQRVKFASGNINIDDILQRTSLSDRLTVFLSTITLPLSSSRPYHEQMIKSLQMSPNIIRSIMTPGTTQLNLTKEGDLHDDILRLLQLLLQYGQYNIACEISNIICGDLSDPSSISSTELHTVLHIIRLTALLSHTDLVNDLDKHNLQSCICSLLGNTAIWISSYGTVVEDLIITLYDRLLKSRLAHNDAVTHDTNLLLQIADLWLCATTYDPTSALRYVLELARSVPPSSTMRDILIRALQSVTGYRTRLIEHNDVTSTDYIPCVHVDLLMQLYRIEITLQSVSSCMKTLQIEQQSNIRAQAIFWLQAADISRSTDQAESRLARAEALLRQADDDDDDDKVEGDGEVQGRLIPSWVSTTRVAFQLPKSAWRVFGKCIEPGSGSNIDIGINDIDYIGLGIDIDHISAYPSPYIISHLHPNHKYIFAYKTSPQSSMVGTSRIIRTCLSLPSSYIWAYLSHIAYHHHFPTLAHRAARRAVQYIQQPNSNSQTFPIQYGAAKFTVLDKSKMITSPVSFIEAITICYQILSDTLQLPASLPRTCTHIRSLHDSEWFLIRRAHWFQLSVLTAVSIHNRDLVYDCIIRLYTCITPILDHHIINIFIIPSLQALFHIDKPAAWPKPIAIVALRMAAVLIRMSDNLSTISAPLLSRSDVDQLLCITDCIELHAFRAILSRSSSLELRNISGLANVSVLDPDLINMLDELSPETRAVLSLQATNLSAYDVAIQYVRKDIGTGSTGISALSQLVECICIWRKNMTNMDTSSDISLGWYWYLYRYLDITDLSLPSPTIISAAAAAAAAVPIHSQFWSNIQSTIQLAYNAHHWHLLQMALRLIRNVCWGSTTPTSDQFLPIHGVLSAIATLCLDMIQSIRDQGQGQDQHDRAPGGLEVLQAPALDLAWGLRYSTAHDLVSQPEWRTSLWFMAISHLDLDLIYGAVLAPTLWVLFRARQWSDLVRLGQRWDTLTQANWAVRHLHYVRFAQHQLLNEARGRHDADLQCLANLDVDMATTRADSARRRAQKRSRLSKQEEDDRLAAAVAVYETKRKELVEHEAATLTELKHNEQVRNDLDILHDDIRRDYPISARKLDQARQSFIHAIDNNEDDPTSVLSAYHKVIKIARSKQETILLSRALLDLGDIQQHYQLYDDARRTWTTLVDCLSVNTVSDLGDRNDLLHRIGFWNCIYGAVGQYRLGHRSPHVAIKRNSARICSGLAWAVLAMTKRHPSERIRLVSTYNRPEPVVPALDLAQQPDRIRYADLTETFMFAARHALHDDRPLDALAPITIVLDVARTDPTVTIEALALKAKVCISLGYISEAVSLVYRLIRSRNIPWTTPSSVTSDGPAWRNDVPFSGNEECIRYLCKEEISTSIPDCVRHAYGLLLIYFISLGRFECYDTAKKLIEKFPTDVAYLHLERGSISECIQQCDDILRSTTNSHDVICWSETITLQLQAMQSSAINYPTDTIRHVAHVLEHHAIDAHDRRLQRRAQIALIQADLVAGVALDHILERYRTVIEQSQDEDQQLLPESIDAVLSYVTLLLQRQSPDDATEAVQRLETLLKMYLDQTRAYRCMMLPMNRYLPCLRTLIRIYVSLSSAYELVMDLDHAKTAASDAAHYMTMLPYTDIHLETLVTYRQIVSGCMISTEIAVSCINQIITGCGHPPRILRRVLLALSKQLTDPNMIAQCLTVAANVTDCARRLQRNMLEIGATSAPVDKLDPNIQRDLRDLSMAFAVQARTQLLPVSNSADTSAIIEAVKKELPKISTLDIIQLLVALRNDQEYEHRSNQQRCRYMQILHGFLRDHVPVYRNTCCISKLELDTLRTPVSGTAAIMAWERSTTSTTQVQVRFVSGSVVGLARANCAVLARLYRQAGACRLTLAERRPQSVQMFAEIIGLIHEAFHDMTADPIPDIEMSIEMAIDIQRIFDIDGVQIVDNNPVLIRILTPILQRSAITIFT